MGRRFCVGGNWKMNGDKNAITLICRNLAAGPLDPNTEVVVGCPAVYLEYARSLLPAEIGVAGQVSCSTLVSIKLCVCSKFNSNFFLFRSPHSPSHRMLTKCQVEHSPVKFRQPC